MSHFRRFILIGVAALLVGLATNVALTWAIAAWAPLPNEPPMTGAVFMQWDRLWSAVERQNAGSLIMGWMHATGTYVSPQPRGSFLERMRATQRAMDMTPEEVRAQLNESQERRAIERPGYTGRNHPPSWGTFASIEPPENLTNAGADWAFGWPMRSMWCRIRSHHDWGRVTGGEIDGGLLLSGRPSSVMRDFRVLPYWPIWPGLIFNTMFFALVWIALLVGPWLTRRWLRIRRGCCASCGYDLRGITSERCPECGITRARLRLRAG